MLEAEDREVLRCQMWKMAGFCGVEVLTYCILSNHFHILAKVPPKQELPDAELLRRFAIVYDEDEVRALEESLASDARDRVREALLKRMHDISFFMKELKMRFTIYYNNRYDRFGTLWAERFKSLLVESKGKRDAVLAVAAYIDLNPVRAGVCTDPKEYRFCGYAEAMGGGTAARAGLRWILSLKEWREAARAYRVVLFGTGTMSNRSRESGTDPEASRAVMDAYGSLSLAELLRCRVRYFSDGLALGTKDFVLKVRAMVFEEGRRKWEPPKAGLSEESEFCFARRRRTIRGDR